MGGFEVDMKRLAVIALVVTVTGAFGCGSPAAPSSSFKAGRYVFLLSHGSLVPAEPPCSGLTAGASYNASVQFDADGTGRGRGLAEHTGATFDLRIQVDGDNLAGTITGALRDASFSVPPPGPATLTFAANSDGSPARFVGRYSFGLGGSGSIDGRPTISLPSTPPTIGVCSPGQLRWTLLGPI